MKKPLKNFFWGNYDDTANELDQGLITPKLYIFSLLLVIAVFSLIFQWEMSVLFGINLTYGLAYTTLCSSSTMILFCLAYDNFFTRAVFHINRLVLNGIFGIAVVGQIMSWIGLITLPIF